MLHSYVTAHSYPRTSSPWKLTRKTRLTGVYRNRNSCGDSYLAQFDGKRRGGCVCGERSPKLKAPGAPASMHDVNSRDAWRNQPSALDLASLLLLSATVRYSSLRL
jgi:hypothetical protein